MISERFGYRFKTGKFAGKTMEQVMLRSTPDLYRLVEWARDKPQLSHLIKEFEGLRTKLRDAPIVAHCSGGCKRRPTRMTLPLGHDHYYWPDPYFWCRKHEPWEHHGISPMLLIHFDLLNSFEEKKNRTAVHRSVLIALGMKRSRITEEFARKYFASLS
jgi:hypothetical protein